MSQSPRRWWIDMLWGLTKDLVITSVLIAIAISVAILVVQLFE